MSLNDSIRYYRGVVTGSSGELTAGTLAYKFEAVDVADNTHRIWSSSPILPRRPFGGNIEIEAALPVGSSIMVVESNGKLALILIDQEKYATTECE